MLLFGRLVFWLEPFAISVDESTYLAVAEAWNHYGKAYVDGVDRKPPFLYGLYEVIGDIFGFFNIHAVHMVFLLITLVICLIAERIVQSRPNPPKKGLAAFLMALVSATFSREFLSSNSELAMLVPLGIAYVLLFLAIDKNLRGAKLFGIIFLSSCLAAVSTALKQVGAVPFALSISFWCLFLLSKRDISKTFLVSAAVVLGVVSVYSCFVVYYWLRGTLDDFLLWNIWDNFAYVADTKNVPTPRRPLFSPLLIALVSWPVLWWGLIVRWKQFLRDRAFTILVGGLLGGWLLISVSGRLFSHYFVPFSFFVVICGASGVGELIKKRQTQMLAYVGLALPFLICFVTNTFRDETLGRFGMTHTFNKTRQAEIAVVSGHIKSITGPQDRIVVWGMASQIYIQSERGSGTRFIPADYVSGRMGGMSSPSKHPYFDRNLNWYLEDMEAKKPAIFVDTAEANLNDYGYFPIKEYPRLFEYLQAHYRYDGAVAGFGIWRRKD